MEKIPEELLQNAHKFQKTIDNLKSKIDKITVTGQAGGGMVEVDMNGREEMTAVRIEPDAAGDIEMLQDLILAAYNSAVGKLKEAVNDELGSYTNMFKNLLPDSLKF
jgi:DNA-binding YbaB/EbfC family protein